MFSAHAGLSAALASFIWLHAALPSAAAGDDIPAPPEFADVRAFVEDAIQRRLAPSVAVGVVRDGELVWAEGLGAADLKTQRPATSRSIYRLASISKPITATGLMILVEQGRIDLDAPANRYLPHDKLRCYAGAADEMTIRRLANHTAGMPLHYSFYYEGTPPPAMDETIRCYGFAAARPGSRWEYSNLAFGVLNYITEVASGTAWREFMESQVYDPLKMTHTSDRIRPGCESDAVVQYNRLPIGGFAAVGHYDFDHPGASAVCSSVQDLARFARMHLNGGTLDGVRILSPEAVRRMQEVTGHYGNDGEGCGVSWFVSTVRGQRCIAHGGGMPGVSTSLQIFPDANAAIIVLTNGTERSLTSGVSRRLAAVLFPDEPPIAAPRPAVFSDSDSAGTPPASESTEAEPDGATLSGTWRGRIVHPDGDLDATLDLQTGDEASFTLGGQPEHSLSDLTVGRDRVNGRVTVDLRTRSDDEQPVLLELRLELEDDRLAGVAIAHGGGRFALSHHIELRRVPD